MQACMTSVGMWESSTHSWLVAVGAGGVAEEVRIVEWTNKRREDSSLGYNFVNLYTVLRAIAQGKLGFRGNCAFYSHSRDKILDIYVAFSYTGRSYGTISVHSVEYVSNLCNLRSVDLANWANCLCHLPVYPPFATFAILTTAIMHYFQLSVEFNLFYLSVCLPPPTHSYIVNRISNDFGTFLPRRSQNN